MVTLLLRPSPPLLAPTPLLDGAYARALSRSLARATNSMQGRVAQQARGRAYTSTVPYCAALCAIQCCTVRYAASSAGRLCVALCTAHSCTIASLALAKQPAHEPHGTRLCPSRSRPLLVHITVQNTTTASSGRSRSIEPWLLIGPSQRGPA